MAAAKDRKVAEKEPTNQNLEGTPLPRQEEVKAIVCDVDGTLLEHGTQDIHPLTIQAIRQLRKTRPDLPIIISTGKQLSAVLDVKETLNLTSQPSIHLNGTLIYNSANQIIHSAKLPLHGLVLPLYNALHLLRQDQPLFPGLSIFFYSHDKVFEIQCPKNPTDWGSKLRQLGEDVTTFSHSSLPSLEEFMLKIHSSSLIVLKMAFGLSPDHLDALKQYLGQEAYKDLAIQVQAIPFCVELISRDAAKGPALEILTSILQLSPRDCLCFGDGQNDVSMFEKTGFPVAMQDGMAAAKKSAKYTTESASKGGVGLFLHKIYPHLTSVADLH